MYYYSLGSWGRIALAVIIGTLQTLIPVVSKTVITSANGGYFGLGWGLLYSLTGFMIGAVIAYGLGLTVNRILTCVVGKDLNTKKTKSVAQIAVTFIVMLSCLLPLWQMQTGIYLAGLVRMRFRVYIIVCSVSGLLAYIYSFTKLAKA